MFGVLAAGVRTSESYSHFTEQTLLSPEPISCWPAQLGSIAATVIKGKAESESSARAGVLVWAGGAGRVTLEVLRSCNNLAVVHCDQSPQHYDLLRQLLHSREITWSQPREGQISEVREFKLEAGECEASLLTDKNNSLLCVCSSLEELPSNVSTKYKVVVADLRARDSADSIRSLSLLMDHSGLLILGSIDDIDEEATSSAHAAFELRKQFERIPMKETEALFPHIYKETLNKHQFAISFLSVWKKKGSENQEDCMENSGREAAPKDAVEYYEDRNILNSYDMFHFGEGLLSVKNFPLRMSEVCLEACRKYNTNFQLALDAGCGPGRTAIELCAEFSKVCAYDYSEGFVENMKIRAKEMKVVNLEGRQGDSHRQQEMYPVDQKFDLIFGCNLIDRLHTPSAWLSQSKEMLAEAGLLIISSPYTWKSEHTHPDSWIGGLVRDGRNLTTKDGLCELLGPQLELLESLRVPFVIPDSDGTFQYTYSNTTIFGRRH